MVLVVDTKMRVTAKEQYATVVNMLQQQKIEFGIFSGAIVCVYMG